VSPQRATGIVLPPLSTGNGSDKFRVVDYWQYVEHRRAGTLPELPVISEHGTRRAADKARDVYTVAGVPYNPDQPALGPQQRCERCAEAATVRLTTRTRAQGKTVRRVLLCTPHAEMEERRARRTQNRVDSEPLAGA
jgi:hypothetical protein